MKKQTRLLILLAIVFISLSIGPALAKEDGEKEHKSGKSKIEISIKNEVGIENREKVEIKNDKFEIRGIITAVVGNNFTVAGQTIFMDPTQVKEFKQKGILEIGKDVKVEGIIKNGVKLATEIKVLGDGSGRFKLEIKGSPFPTALPTASPLPTSSLTMSPSPSASPTASNSASPTPQATSSADIRVKVKANGTIEQVNTFLQQILNYLKSLV